MSWLGERVVADRHLVARPNSSDRILVKEPDDGQLAGLVRLEHTHLREATLLATVVEIHPQLLRIGAGGRRRELRSGRIDLGAVVQDPAVTGDRAPGAGERTPTVERERFARIRELVTAGDRNAGVRVVPQVGVGREGKTARLLRAPADIVVDVRVGVAVAAVAGESEHLAGRHALARRHRDVGRIHVRRPEKRAVRTRRLHPGTLRGNHSRLRREHRQKIRHRAEVLALVVVGRAHVLRHDPQPGVVVGGRVPAVLAHRETQRRRAPGLTRSGETQADPLGDPHRVHIVGTNPLLCAVEVQPQPDLYHRILERPRHQLDFLFVHRQPHPHRVVHPLVDRGRRKRHRLVGDRWLSVPIGQDPERVRHPIAHRRDGLAGIDIDCCGPARGCRSSQPGAQTKRTRQRRRDPHRAQQDTKSGAEGKQVHGREEVGIRPATCGRTTNAERGAGSGRVESAARLDPV